MSAILSCGRKAKYCVMASPVQILNQPVSNHGFRPSGERTQRHVSDKRFRRDKVHPMQSCGVPGCSRSVGSFPVLNGDFNAFALVSWNGSSVVVRRNNSARVEMQSSRGI